MSPGRTLRLVARDLRSGPRSAVFLFAVFMPLLVTFLIKLVFLTLLSPKARLAVADLGESAVTRELRGKPGIELTLTDDPGELRRLVEDHVVDGGLVLGRDFDELLRAGRKPRLEFHLAGESLASDRIVLAVTALDAVRQVEGEADPVEVVLRTPGGGGDAAPLSVRLVPAILLFVLLVSGIFVPAFMLVEERERRTLHALLVTPVRMSEILISKALLGLIMAVVMSLLTLALNDAMGGEAPGLLVSLAAAAVMCIEIGLIYGTLVRDGKTLYTLTKSLNPLLAGPVVFYLFPSWPQWIARLFPTWWFIDPLYRVSLQGASLADVAPDLAVAFLICLCLAPLILLLGRRMLADLATS